MDRLEVTNRDYKRFVDSGGYRRREFWKGPFVKDGRELSWEQAMRLMTDRTGRPGPSTWEAGEYPRDQADFPVGGVSWYEAAAFARFAGKALPSVVHWNHAAGVHHSASIVPLSNFSGRGPAQVGSSGAISQFGTLDMAGNVREWCLNPIGDQRFILGGGWNDAPYQFNDAYSQPPFDRSPTNGIRLVRYLSDSNLALAAGPRSVARSATSRRNARSPTPSSPSIAGCTTTTGPRSTPRCWSAWTKATGSGSWRG